MVSALSQLSSKKHRFLTGIHAVIPYILVCAGFVLLLTLYTVPHYDPDSVWYIQMAQGNHNEVTKPFTNRILHPAVVRILAASFSIDTYQSFWLTGAAALFTLVITVTIILHLSTPYPIIAIPLLFTPFLLNLYGNYYVQDIFHAALLGLFFLLFLSERYWVAFMVLFLLILTRESTVMLSACIILAGLYKPHRKFAIGAAVVTVSGILLVSYLGRMGRTNIHDLNNILYLLLTKL